MLIAFIWAAGASSAANPATPPARHTGQAFGTVQQITSVQIKIWFNATKTSLVLIIKSNVTLNDVKEGDFVTVVYETEGKNNVLVSLEKADPTPVAPQSARHQQYGATAELDIPATPARKEPKHEQVQQLADEQAALVERAIGQEKLLIKNIELRTPVVETYIQDTRPDGQLLEVPVQDRYWLSRVDFGKTFTSKSFEPRSTAKRSHFKDSFAVITGLTKALGLEKFTYSPTGFLQMMFLDPTGFDSQHYAFSYVRRESLGSVRTWVFDLHPKIAGMGRFYGRIWIEDEGGNVVRFNGTYSGSSSGESSEGYFHFDSWRVNVQPGIWLPVAVYMEETTHTKGDIQVGLKAQTHFWGYSLKLPTRYSDNDSLRLDEVSDQNVEPTDVSPLQATRAWVTEAEDNVIDRLVGAGLVAPLNQDGYENKVLDQIVINLAVSNNLAFTDQIRTRVLLTNTLEATTVGNTILISKGLLDSLPDEPAIASVVAMELAHIANGHHVDTRYAFNDRLLFPDESSFQRINLNHTNRHNEEAAKKAMEYLQNSMYKDRLPSAGLYYAQLADRAKGLKALTTPKLGDSLLKADGTPWMIDLEKMAPKLNWDDLSQRAANPLGFQLKIDPWDDKAHQLSAEAYTFLNPRDKMPFEIMPITYNLQRYDEARVDSPAVPPAPPPEAPKDDRTGPPPDSAPVAPPPTAQHPPTERH